ncbi:hypothetical protein PIB30_097870 [Stylosanthes scabra]|uniref:DUF4283 domain-containing protein n=1 Tax=Stylosanthes scabra TaxID=79078 RepID=A0ABU6XTZ2_9FABA|nr:hypothetical protein [Stylosanthes scabra]
MYKLLEDWKGPGRIECRDIGPFRCLITFDTVEIKEAEVENELLLSLFDEVKPHWEIFWSLSRRIWIEIMGLPIGLWSSENYNKIVKLSGKIVRIDDRTEESKSFTTARILLDCFQWERIHEWITLRIDGREFEVFVKEFGSEVYSVQSHPDLDSESYLFMAEEEPHVELERPAVVNKAVNLNFRNVIDPVVNAIMMNNWVTMQTINSGGGLCGTTGVNKEVNGAIVWSESTVSSYKEEERVNDLDLDPMVWEAQLGAGVWSKLNKAIINPNQTRTVNSNAVSVVGHKSGSSSTCPFSLGFGPCKDQFHVHRTSARAPSDPEWSEDISETPIARRKSTTGEGDCDGGCSEEIQSDETLYLINEEARARADFFADFDGPGNAAIVRAESATAVEESEEDFDHYEGQRDWLIEGADCTGGDSRFRGPAGEHCKEDGSETRLREEVTESKKLWSKGGISFDSNDEEEILVRLVDRKLDGKKRIDLRPKKQRQGRKTPCIQGRTLATRTLRLGAKSKLK